MSALDVAVLLGTVILYLSACIACNGWILWGVVIPFRSGKTQMHGTKIIISPGGRVTVGCCCGSDVKFSMYGSVR